MNRIRGAVLLGSLALALPAQVEAQSSTGHAAAAGHASAAGHVAAPAIMEALVMDIEQAEAKLLALAEAMPESTWNWRPAEGVRSVGEVILHIAADNYFIPAFTGVAAPAETGIVATSYPSVQAFEARELGKAEAIAEMRVSFEHLKRAMRGVDDAALGARLEVFGMEMSGLGLWVLTVTHLHEHLGQNIAYARSNGVVPPWSR